MPRSSYEFFFDQSNNIWRREKLWCYFEGARFNIVLLGIQKESYRLEECFTMILLTDDMLDSVIVYIYEIYKTYRLENLYDIV